MRSHQPFNLALALVFSIGLLAGCGFGVTPAASTPEQVLKADAKTQKAMRDYYGSLDKKGKSRGKSRAK